MQSEKLTDEQLWRAIAQNTNAMTALIHQLLELDPAINTLTDTIRQAKLRESNAERIGKLEGNYKNTLPSFVAASFAGIGLTQQSRQPRHKPAALPSPPTMQVWEMQGLGLSNWSAS